MIIYGPKSSLKSDTVSGTMNNIPTLIAISAASLVMVLLSLALDKQGFIPWASAALLNAGTGILTSVVIIYAYDRLIAIRSEKERALRESRALSSIGPAIRQHYRTLLDCYRSAYDSTEIPKFVDINEFLGPQFQPVVEHLNLYSPSPSDSSGSKPYYTYICESFNQLHGELSLLVSLAGHDLSQEIYLSARRVLDSDFMRVARSSKELCSLSIPGIGHPPSKLITGMKPQIESYCSCFAQLASAIEKVQAQGLREYRESDWYNIVFPPGHARVS